MVKDIGEEEQRTVEGGCQRAGESCNGHQRKAKKLQRLTENV